VIRIKKNKVEIALNKELHRLQQMFRTGTELKVLYKPDDIRINQNSKALSGEISGFFIIIYEHDIEKAIATINHEFVEYIIMPLIQDYINIINNQNRLITELLVKRKEEVVEWLANSLRNHPSLSKLYFRRGLISSDSKTQTSRDL
jgi:hypothetical protein